MLRNDAAGNLTEAARLLHTSQPTVSRELARLKVLGLTLFERTRALTSDSARATPVRRGTTLWYGLDRIVSAGGKSARVPSGRTLYRLPAGLSQSLFAAVTTAFSGALSGCQRILCRRSRRCWKGGSPPSAPRLERRRRSAPGRNNPYRRVTNNAKWGVKLPATIRLPQTVLTPDDFSGENFISLRTGRLSTVVGYVICRTSGEAQNGGGNA